MTPALLKTKSTFPCCSMTFSGRDSIASLSDTSSKWEETETLYCLNISTVSFNVSSFTSQTQTSAPSFARSIAKYLPIPDPAPVMTATLSLKVFI